MKIKFYGVRGGFLRPTRQYLTRNLISATIRDGEDILLMDAGSNKILNDENLGKIRNILLTHTHLDHVLHLGRILKKMEQRPRIYSPQRLPQRIKLESRNFDLIKEIPHTISSFEVEHLKTKHARLCYAYKISKGGKSVCFTGDTKYFKELAEFCKGTDMLICESTLADSNKLRAYIRGHMRPAGVRKLAKAAQPKLLVLTHFNKLAPNEFLEEVRKGFPDTIYAYEGLELDV